MKTEEREGAKQRGVKQREEERGEGVVCTTDKRDLLLPHGGSHSEKPNGERRLPSAWQLKSVSKNHPHKYRLPSLVASPHEARAKEGRKEM